MGKKPLTLPVWLDKWPLHHNSVNVIYIFYKINLINSLIPIRLVSSRAFDGQAKGFLNCSDGATIRTRNQFWQLWKFGSNKCLFQPEQIFALARPPLRKNAVQLHSAIFFILRFLDWCFRRERWISLGSAEPSPSRGFSLNLVKASSAHVAQ